VWLCTQTLIAMEGLEWQTAIGLHAHLAFSLASLLRADRVVACTTSRRGLSPISRTLFSANTSLAKTACGRHQTFAGIATGFNVFFLSVESLVGASQAPGR